MLSAERDVMVHAFPNIESGGAASAATESGPSVRDAESAYRELTGVLPEAANIDGDAHFDRHVLASILALASSEGGSLAAQAGLTDAELGDLFSHYFAARSIESSGDRETSLVDADEIEMVRDLLLENRSSEGELRSLARRDDRAPRHGAQPSLGGPRASRQIGTDAADRAPFRAARPTQRQEHALEAVHLPHDVRERRFRHVQHARVLELRGLRALLWRGNRDEPRRIGGAIARDARRTDSVSSFEQLLSSFRQSHNLLVGLAVFARVGDGMSIA